MLLKERNGDPDISHWQGKPGRKEGGKLIVVSVTSNRVTVEGHAGYAKSGEDIVCAAASVLANNLVNSLKQLTDDEIEYENNVGLLDVRFKNLSKLGKLLVDSFFIGICDIKKEYPGYIKIK